MIQKGLIFLLIIFTCGVYADWQNEDFFQNEMEEKFERLVSTNWEQPAFNIHHGILDQTTDTSFSVEQDQRSSPTDHLTNSVAQLSNFYGNIMKKKRRKRKKEKVDEDLYLMKPIDSEPYNQYDKQGFKDRETSNDPDLFHKINEYYDDNLYEYDNGDIYQTSVERIENEEEPNTRKKEHALSWAIRMGLKATELQMRRRMGLDGGNSRQDMPPGLEFLGAGVSFQELLEEALAKGLETIAFVATDVLMTIGWPEE